MKAETRQRLMGALRGHGLTQEIFAREIGMHPKTFNRKLNGHQDFTWDEVERIIEKLDLKDNTDELHRIFF